MTDKKGVDKASTNVALTGIIYFLWHAAIVTYIVVSTHCGTDLPIPPAVFQHFKMQIGKYHASGQINCVKELCMYCQCSLYLPIACINTIIQKIIPI